jgi:hypothetical protein
MPHCGSCSAWLGLVGRALECPCAADQPDLCFAQTSAALFFVFVGAALLVLVHQTFQMRAQRWESALLEYPDLLGWRVVASGAMVVVALCCSRRYFQRVFHPRRLFKCGNGFVTRGKDVQARWDRTFSTINAPANAAGGGFADRSLTLSGERTLGNGLVMEV